MGLPLTVMVHAAGWMVLAAFLWVGYTKLCDFEYGGPWPDCSHGHQVGDTMRDHNGKLWIYSTDMVASCFWKPGHLWAHIRERHNNARDAVE